MNRLVFFVTFLFSVLFFTPTVQAKMLPQATKGAGKPKTAAVSSGISVYPKFRADRRALEVSFGNLQNAKSVSYALTYNTSEQEEGAIGTLNLSNPANNSAELLFGTCSKNVCRYHTGISNMKLEVSYTSKSGSKYTRRYKMRV